MGFGNGIIPLKNKIIIMATTYSTRIDEVNVQQNGDGLQNVVTRISYIVSAISDDNLRKDMPKQIELPPPSSSDFIDITNITNDTLIEWITNHPNYLTEDDKRIFEIRFDMEREKSETKCYNFPFLTSNAPFLYMN